MSRPTTLVDEFRLSREDYLDLARPRTGLVEERPDPERPGRFLLQRGMFETYERELSAEDGADGMLDVRQRVTYSASLSGFGPLVALALRRALRSRSQRLPIPGWLPPDPLEAAAARQLATIVMVSVSTAYFATLLGQTLTFTAREFSAPTSSQAWVLLTSRFDILPGFALLALVNRVGRVAMMRASVLLGALLTAFSALSPDLEVLAVLQVLAKGTTAAAAVLVTILAAEIVAPRQRAWAIGSLVVGAALGAGFCDVLLPIAGISLGSWRVLYLIGIPMGAWGVRLTYLLRETERFRHATVDVPKERRRVSLSGSRVMVLSVAAFAVNAFLIPTTQFRNEYLRVERHFSASMIGLFVILTNIPGALGLALGSRLSETRGRRVVAAAAIVFGGGGIALGFATGGLSLWVTTLIGSTAVTAIVPSLGVYQTEMFQTRARGLGGGIVTVASRIGSILGVLFVGYFSSRISLGVSVALLFFGMLALVPLLFAWFPETGGLELEQISSED